MHTTKVMGKAEEEPTFGLPDIPQLRQFRKTNFFSTQGDGPGMQPNVLSKNNPS